MPNHLRSKYIRHKVYRRSKHVAYPLPALRVRQRRTSRWFIPEDELSSDNERQSPSPARQEESRPERAGSEPPSTRHYDEILAADTNGGVGDDVDAEAEAEEVNGGCTQGGCTQDDNDELFADGVVDLEQPGNLQPMDTPEDTTSDGSADESFEGPSRVSALVPSPPSILKSLSNVSDLCLKFSAAMIGHDISEEGARALWDLMSDNSDLINRARKEYNGGLPSFKTVQRKAKELIPTIEIEACWMRHATQELIVQSRLRELPQKDEAFKLMYELSTARISAIVQTHREQGGPLTSQAVDLSMDGVQENNTSGVSLEIVSLRFKGCHHVYPVAIYRPNAQRQRVDSVQKLLMPVVHACLACGVKVDKIICDAPERAVVCSRINHNGYFACDLCEEEGSGMPGVPGVRWPYTRNQAPERTHQAFQENAMEARRKLEAAKSKRLGRPGVAVTKGVTNYTPLLDMEGFDIVRDVPVDYMHNICMGVYRRTFMLIFEALKTGTAGRRADRAALSELQADLWSVKVPSEFSRRTRDFTLKYTAEEWRNLCIFFFPLAAARTAESGARDILYLMAYLVRAYLEDDLSFRPVLRSGSLEEIMEDFYWKYDAYFDRKDMTYNLHVMSHLSKIRQAGPLTAHSAFQFERSYGAIKMYTRLGKRSKGKRAMEKVLMRATMDHRCTRRARLQTHPATRSDDTMVYTQEVSNRDGLLHRHRFFVLCSLDVGGASGDQGRQHSAQELEVSDYTVSVLGGRRDLRMNDVGCYKYEGPGQCAYVNHDDIRGKAIRVGEFIITVPMNVLLET